jgi:hypothetical protein
MKKLVILMLIVILSLVVVFNGCKSPEEEEPVKDLSGIFKLIPRDSSGIFYVNVKKISRIRKSSEETYNDIEKKIIQNIRQTDFYKNYEEFLEISKINPKKDIYSFLLVFMDNISFSDKTEKFLLLVNLKYDKESVLLALKEKIVNLKEETYAQKTVYKQQLDKEELSIALLDSERIAVGDLKSVKDALDLMRGTGSSILENTEIRPYLGKVQSNSLFSILFKIPREIRQKKIDQGTIKFDLSNAKLLFGSIDYRNMSWWGDFIILSPNKTGNLQTAETLNRLKVMGPILGPEINAFLNKLKISATDSEIKLNFTISDKFLQDVKEKLNTQVGKYIKKKI